MFPDNEEMWIKYKELKQNILQEYNFNSYRYLKILAFDV